MALRFPIYIRQKDGQSIALTPALPGWSHAAQNKKDALKFTRGVLFEALNNDLEPRGFPVDMDQIESGFELVYLTLEEPSGWWYADPSE
jgi:hypothetical protein